MSYINSVTTNMQSMFTQRQLGITDTSRKKSTEKLASGYKINRAADDAAGLTISEKMRRQIRGLTQASANTQDAVSLCQVADGYLTEVHDMLHRLDELVIQASNGTLKNEDRASINEEVDELKQEMKRIFKEANFNGIPLFHVPYTPDIEGNAEGMKVFHNDFGGIGGLEFNNVRYNISELQAKGLKIDDNGIATETFEHIKFNLYDGEEVDLSMKKGQDLNKVSRNFKWTADETGIYINEKLSAQWNEVRDEDGNGIDISSNVPIGTYTFKHHGLTITFDIDEEAEPEEVLTGINGDAATKAASWDVLVGSAELSKAADVFDADRVTTPPEPYPDAVQTITVTGANKGYVDGNYWIVADANGIAIRSIDKGGTERVTDYVSWGSFKDSAYSSWVDENGNTIDTNGGYPIKNWGDVNDGNAASDITFDGNATYHFTSPDSNVKIEFDFRLAESASLDEVKQALNRAVISYPVSAPGSLTAGASTSVGRITLNSSTNYIASSFTLQRAYGRNFDSTNDSFSADISVTREVSGRKLEDDAPNADGVYDAGGHAVNWSSNYDSQTHNRTEDSSDVTYSYYVWNETNTVTVTDESGNPVQDTDEYGNPKTDEHGDPVYKTTEVTTPHYYKYRTFNRDEIYTDTYRTTDSWSQDVTYTFNGTLNSHSMIPVERSQTEQYSRTLTRTRQETQSFTIFESMGEVSADSLDDTQKSSAVAISGTSSLPADASTYTGTSYGAYTTATKGTTNYNGVSATSFNNISFTSDAGEAFRFNYTVTPDQAKTLAQSGSGTAGTVTFKANGYATRTFTPTETGKTISEAQFNDFRLNVPKKNLDIQAGAEAEHYVTMEWSPLNLTIIGLSGCNTLTQESALGSIAMVNRAVGIISETRSTFGAYQNRFEATIRNLDNVVENTQAAESAIRDTDMAAETVRNAKENILMQAGSAMLVQANQSRQGILTLLQ